jgi:hypothetical protein
MGWQAERMNRIDYLIAVCVKNNITPNHNAFADLIIRTSESRFGVRRDTSKSYVDTLINAWRDDKWKYRVQNNPYLTEQEKKEWMGKHE